MDVGKERSKIDLSGLSLERRLYWESRIRSIDSLTTEDLKLELARVFEKGLHQHNSLTKAAKESLGIGNRY